MLLKTAITLVAGLCCATAVAREPYVAVALGGHRTPGMTVASTSNDRASVCDEYINPRAREVPGCTTANRGAGESWKAPYDDAGGFSAEAELGWRWSERLRTALTYGYRSTELDETVAAVDVTGAAFDKLTQR